MPRSRGLRLALSALAVAAASLVISGQGITIPNTFVNGTVADAPQVNANFTALANNALNRNGGTMLGTLSSRDVIPTADATYDLGTAVLRFRDAYLSRNVTIGGTLGVTGATTLSSTLGVTGAVTLTSASTTINTVAYSWPAGQGVAGSMLQNNGSGTLSWSAPEIGRCNLRLTLTSGTAVTTADVLAASSVFVTPTPGAQCAFYDGSASWVQLSGIAEVTVAVPATTSTLYDVFCFNNAGTMACDAAVAWTNDTTRATALATQNNVYVKTGATTRRYIGSFRTTTVNGQTEDSAAKRYVWSYYNRVPRTLQRLESTVSWIYNTAAYRQANGAAANQVDVVVGVAEVAIDLRVTGSASNAAAGTVMMVSIGEDSTTVVSPSAMQPQVQQQVSGDAMPLFSSLTKYPAVGRHFYAWLEFVSVAAGNTTFVGTTGTGTPQSGIVGTLGS